MVMVLAIAYPFMKSETAIKNMIDNARRVPAGHR